LPYLSTISYFRFFARNHLISFGTVFYGIIDDKDYYAEGKSKTPPWNKIEFDFIYGELLITN